MYGCTVVYHGVCTRPGQALEGLAAGNDSAYLDFEGAQNLL